MTGMEHAIEKAAAWFEFTDEEWREYQAIPDQGYSHRDWLNRRMRRKVEELAAAGVLAPAPLREGGVGWYEVIHPSRATTHIAYVHEDGSIYFPEGTQVLDTHEFAFAAATGRAHRLVRSDAVDRAEGDGSADQ